jgi:hypothetical protein
MKYEILGRVSGPDVGHARIWIIVAGLICWLLSWPKRPEMPPREGCFPPARFGFHNS